MLTEPSTELAVSSEKTQCRDWTQILENGRCRDLLAESMNPRPVLDYLCADFFPPDSEAYQAVRYAARTRSDKNRKLLKAVSAASPDCIEAFFNALVATNQGFLIQHAGDILSVRGGADEPDLGSASPWSPPQCESTHQTGGRGVLSQQQALSTTADVDWSTLLVEVKGHAVWKTVCEGLGNKGTVFIPGWSALLHSLALVGITSESIEKDLASSAIEHILELWCKQAGRAATVNELARHLKKIKRLDTVEAISEHLPRRRLRDRLCEDEFERLLCAPPVSEDVTDTFPYLSSELSVEDCDRLLESLGVDWSAIRTVRYNCACDAARGNRQMFAKWQQAQTNYNVAALVEKLEMFRLWRLAEKVAEQHGVMPS